MVELETRIGRSIAEPSLGGHVSFPCPLDRLGECYFQLLQCLLWSPLPCSLQNVPTDRILTHVQATLIQRSAHNLSGFEENGRIDRAHSFL